MKRFLLGIVLTLCVCCNLFAAYPYDSIAKIVVGKSGGSATLVAVTDSEALLLTAAHVAMRVGNNVRVVWPSGDRSTGKVIELGKYKYDIAMVLCPRPKGLRPVPITLPNSLSTGRITNIGYPGNLGLEWQTGELYGISRGQITYSCRPIPGMSGGATLDQYGNLIGVITRYGPRSGESSSGTDMMNFVSRYMKSAQAKTWETQAASFSEPVAKGKSEQEILAPDDWESYILYIGLVYNVHPFEPEPEPLPEVKEKEPTLSLAAKTPIRTNRKKCRRTRVRRRLLRWRR